MRFLLTIFAILLLSSCISNKNTSYRVVNKNGKVVYFERKKPLLNSNIISDKQELTNIQNINKKIKNTKEVEKINNNTIDNNLILGSSAYSLKSVVDTVVKEEDISYVARKIDKNKKIKTIQDFVIPEYYFNDNLNKQRIDNRTKEEKIKQIELENKENEQKYGLFARIFGGNRNKITENLMSEEDKEQIRKIELENQKNEQKYGLFARIFGGNRNTTINDMEKITEETINENKSIIINNDETEELKVGSVIIDKNQQLGKSKNSKYHNKQNKSKYTSKNETIYKLASTSENKDGDVLKNIKEYKQIDDIKETKDTKEQKNGLFSGLFGKNNTEKENTKNNNNNKKQTTFITVNNTSNKQTVLENNITTQTNAQTPNKSNNSFIQENYLQTNKFYIQLGSFANETKAKKLLVNFRDIGDGGRVVPIKIKDKFVYRSVIGTFNTRISAEREMEKVLNKGHFDCYVFKKK